MFLKKFLGFTRLSFFLFLLLLSYGEFGNASPLYLDPSKPLEDRVENLLKLMTLDEKLSLTAGLNGMDSRDIPRLGIPALKMTDGPNGVRWGKTTAFPTGICLAATWDQALAKREGRALAQEALARGRNVLLGPCVNINRHPFNGRDFESFGEDPWLAGRVSVAYIQGVQEKGVASCVKHFAANNEEGDRMTVDAQVDERTLREIYLPAFEASVKEGGALYVMAAYNRLNGHYCSANPWLLTDVLRKDWGFTGLVVSDWGATHEGTGAAHAGLDLEMPGPGDFMGLKLKPAVEKGELDEKTIDDRVRNILRVILKLGLFERKISDSGEGANTKETQALAQEVAEEGAVLLKNEKDELPLKSSLKRLAVIGPNAATARPGGGGSSQIDPPFAVSPLEGLKDRLAPNVELLYAQGSSLEGDLQPVPASAIKDLKAAYFTNQNLEGKAVLQRSEKDINFNWNEKSPAPAIPREHFSARFQGKIIPVESGHYSLGARGDDGFRVYLDGKLVVDDWNDHAAESRYKGVDLEAGKVYSFTVEYYQGLGDAVVMLGWQKPRNLVTEAVEAAKKANAAVIFAGLSADFESEGSDRSEFSLPGSQNELIQAVSKVNPHTVVVLVAGSPVDMEPWIDSVPAVLQAWYPGMEEGKALARLLTGDANPSGKLPVTFPKKLEDCPAYPNFPGKNGSVKYQEGWRVGYRHYDTAGVEPLFPFGHGLSYTRFEYSNLQWEPRKGGAFVRFDLKNAGTRDGAEVAQLYLRPVKPRVERPFQELKAFQRVALRVGESKSVVLELNDRSFAYYDVKKREWKADKGFYEVRVGSSSRDIQLKETVKKP